MPSSLLRDLPLLDIPPRNIPSYENLESQAKIAYVVCSLCMVFMWPIFLLRIYCKIWITHMFGPDDSTSYSSLVFCPYDSHRLTPLIVATIFAVVRFNDVAIVRMAYLLISIRLAVRHLLQV